MEFGKYPQTAEEPSENTGEPNYYQDIADPLNDIAKERQAEEEILANLNDLKEIGEEIKRSVTEDYADNLLRGISILDKKVKEAPLKKYITYRIRTELCNLGRDIASDIGSKKGNLEHARQMTLTLRDIFGDVPELNSCLQKDLTGIRDTFAYNDLIREMRSAPVFAEPVPEKGLTKKELKKAAKAEKKAKKKSRKSGKNESKYDYNDYEEAREVKSGCFRFLVILLLLSCILLAVVKFFPGLISNVSMDSLPVHLPFAGDSSDVSGNEERLYTSQAKEGDLVYTCIREMSPVTALWDPESENFQLFVCKCLLTTGERIYIAFDAADYIKYIDSNVSMKHTAEYSPEMLKFVSPILIHGRMEKTKDIFSSTTAPDAGAKMSTLPGFIMKADMTNSRLNQEDIQFEILPDNTPFA